MAKTAARNSKSKTRPAVRARPRSTVPSKMRSEVVTKAAAKRGAPKWVYAFGGGIAEGRAEMRNLLGGKGAGLAEMANLGLPVPPGFTITTEVCARYYADGKTY